MKHRPWFKVWQDRILSDPKFKDLTLDETGLLFVSWLLNARLTSALQGPCSPATIPLCAVYGTVVAAQYGSGRRLVRQKIDRLLLSLREKGWIEFIDESNFQVIGWENSQAPSESTERVQRHREKMKLSNVSHLSLEKEEEKEKEKDTPLVPKGTSLDRPALRYSEEFERLWMAYPRKVGKWAAYRSFQRAKTASGLNGAFFASVFASVEAHRTMPEWMKDHGQYIPHLSTFLNQGRWDDEVTRRPEITPGMEAFLAKEKKSESV